MTRQICMTASDLLRAYEQGESAPPTERALALLACAGTGREAQALWQLSIGQRDALLFELREQLLGKKLRGIADCPACGQRMHFFAQTAELRSAPPEEVSEGWELRYGDHTLRYRLPNSEDLHAAAVCGDLDIGRRLLVARCLLSVQHAGTAVEIATLADSVLDALSGPLSAAMAQVDPQAEVLLDLRCTDCQHPFYALFDIVSFVWTELRALAQGLVAEVDTLARAYGWREADILAMSHARRQLYLSQLAGTSP